MARSSEISATRYTLAKAFYALPHRAPRKLKGWSEESRRKIGAKENADVRTTS